jgi:hypothetical protein
MKITKEELANIIKEEIEKALGGPDPLNERRGQSRMFYRKLFVAILEVEKEKKIEEAEAQLKAFTNPYSSEFKPIDPERKEEIEILKNRIEDIKESYDRRISEVLQGELPKQQHIIDYYRSGDKYFKDKVKQHMKFSPYGKRRMPKSLEL